MIHRISTLLGLLAMTFVLAVRADQPAAKTGAKPDDPNKKAADIKDKTLLQQRIMAQRFAEFKAAVLRVKQRLEKGSAEDKEKAKALQNALDEIDRKHLDTEFSRMIQILQDKSLSNVGDVGEAVELSRKLAAEMQILINILREDSRAARLREERQRLQEMIKELEGIIKDQKIEIAKAHMDRMNKDDLVKGQKKVSNRAADLNKKIGGKEGDDGKKNDHRGEFKGKGKDGEQAGQGKDKGNGEGEAKDDGSKKVTKRTDDLNKKIGNQGSGKEGGKEGNKGSGKEAGQKGNQGSGKEGGKEGNKGSGKEGGKEGNKGSGKEGGKGSGKESSKGNASKAGGGKGQGKEGAKPSNSKGQGKEGAKPSNSKGQGSQGGAKGGQKPGDGKPRGTNGEGKAKAGKSGEAGKGKGDGSSKEGGQGGKGSQGGKGKGGGKSGQQGNPGNPGDPNNQKKDDQNEDTADARKKIQEGRQYQKDAEKQLEKDDKKKAADKETEAAKKFEEAKKRLEELLKQAREEELERLLNALENRCRQLLEMQRAVKTATVELDKLILNNKDHKPTRTNQQDSGRLGDKEKEIIIEASKAIDMIEAEGSAVAFAEVFKQVRSDMEEVQKLLNATKTGNLTQAIEQDIIDTLEDMIKALQKAKQELGQQKPSQPGPPPNPGDQKLLDQIAELKMIRAMQIKINKRTRLYASEYVAKEGEQTADPAIKTKLSDLSDRQEKLFDVTTKIVKGDNK